MIVVCDMGPLQYLVLIGAEQVLPQMFTRVLTRRDRDGSPVAFSERRLGVSSFFSEKRTDTNKFWL